MNSVQFPFPFFPLSWRISVDFYLSLQSAVHGVEQQHVHPVVSLCSSRNIGVSSGRIGGKMVAVLLLLLCDHVDKQQALTAPVKVNGLQQLLATGMVTGHGLLGLADQGLAMKPVDRPFNGRQLSNRRSLREILEAGKTGQNKPMQI
jgi:hypothetical protein